MSEYQYYEFLAVDRPLTRAEMSELRSVSSRAEITPTSFTNTYNFGDFKGDPIKILERYFDVFVYVANWGTRQVAFRLPAGALDLDEAKPYLTGDLATLKSNGDQVILDICSETEEPEDWEDGSGWMGAWRRCAPS